MPSVGGSAICGKGLVGVMRWPSWQTACMALLHDVSKIRHRFTYTGGVYPPLEGSGLTPRQFVVSIFEHVRSAWPWWNRTVELGQARCGPPLFACTWGPRDPPTCFQIFALRRLTDDGCLPFSLPPSLPPACPIPHYPP